MDVDDFAELLMSNSRREWQDPEGILKKVGVKRGMTVADLGCGPGFFTIPLASMVGEKGLVYAVDSQSGMLRHLRRNLKSAGKGGKVKALEADVSRTSIPSGSVDIALFANILHDIDDKPSFVSEVRRICKPAGVAVDVDWRKEEMENGPPLEIRLSEEQAERVLANGGLRFEGKVGAGPFHYGLKFRLD